jgi:putative transposase
MRCKALYAHVPRGQRVYGLISGQRRPRTFLIAARLGKLFEGPLLFEGTCHTPLFNHGLEKELCPLLNDNHVVVMDNVPFHKSEKTRKLSLQKGPLFSSCRLTLQT